MGVGTPGHRRLHGHQLQLWGKVPQNGFSRTPPCTSDPLVSITIVRGFAPSPTPRGETCEIEVSAN